MTKTNGAGLYKEVTAKILAQMREGAAPWIKPWSGYSGPANPRNATTGRPYSGANVVVLWMAQQANGWGIPAFLTYKQAEAAGGHVRKGETGTTVFKVGTFRKEDENTHEDKFIPYLKAFTVFNVEQCEGLPEGFMPTPIARNPDERIADAEAFIAATGARIKTGGAEAYYRPGADDITMPLFEAFKSASGYYATMFHELGHWTGHKSRLDRSLKGRFGDQAYAAEELIAELTSAFLCAEHQFDGEMRHAGYIESWIKVLEKDERAFFTAASQASKAADFLRGSVTQTEMQEAA